MANSAHRDYRLSWRARGLLGELLSYQDGWDTTVDKLVAKAREQGNATEGRAAMRAAVAELAEIGYVRYIREMDEKGHWTTVMSVCDVPQPEPDARRTRNRTVGGPDRRLTETSVDRTVGEPDCRETETSGGRSITKKTVTKTVNKKDQTTSSESEAQCRTSARFAPGGAGQDDEPNQMLHLDTTPQPRTGWDDWRQRDYDLFLDVLDATHVRSLGGKAGKEGNVYTAAALYDAMQRLPGGGKSGKDWPGRYLETVNVGESGAGVDSWLARHDLERV